MGICQKKVKLREKGVFNGIVERRVRGQSKLRAKQSRNNKRFAKLRGLVELSFAFMKHHMNFKETRYLGLEKNQEHFCLIAACANLRRVPQLMKAYGLKYGKLNKKCQNRHLVAKYITLLEDILENNS